MLAVLNSITNYMVHASVYAVISSDPGDDCMALVEWMRVVNWKGKRRLENWWFLWWVYKVCISGDYCLHRYRTCKHYKKNSYKIEKADN